MPGVAARDEGTITHTQELAAFDDWFGSKQFAGAWAIKQLAVVLPHVGPLRSAHLVMERQANLAPHTPLHAVECLRQMIAGNKRVWQVSISGESLERLLSTALHTTDGPFKQAAIEVVHLLGARGFREIGDLLADSGQK